MNSDLGYAQSNRDVMLFLCEALKLELENDASIFAEYDESKLTLGSKMKTYSFCDGEFEAKESCYFPVFHRNELIAIAVVIVENNEIVGVQISKDLVAELSAYVNAEALSLVFSGDSAYVYSDGNIDFVKSYSDVFFYSEVYSGTSQGDNSEQLIINMENAESAESVVSRVLCPKSPLHAAVARNVPTETELMHFSANQSRGVNSFPSSCSLGATIIQQNGLPICWAATVASVGRYATGIVKTAEEVALQIKGALVGGTNQDAATA